MYDVITVGSATMDVFADTDSELVTITTPTDKEEFIAYPCGSKILIKELNFNIGGGGTNTAVSLTRLGLKTAYLGNLGNDSNAKKVMDLLKREKIDFVGTISEDMTNYSIVLDSIKDDRTILVYKGASEKLKFSNIDKEKIFTSWFYFCALDVKTLEKLSVFAAKRNIKIAFNPSNYIAKKGSYYIQKILDNTELLIVNDEESELLVGKGPVQVRLDRLTKTGPRIAVITHGSGGASVISNDVIYHAQSINVKVKETTGAGDAFGSSFLAGLLLKNSVMYALKLGIANAASVISHSGAKNNLLTIKEANSLINKSKIKVKTVNLKK